MLIELFFLKYHTNKIHISVLMKLIRTLYYKYKNLKVIK